MHRLHTGPWQSTHTDSSGQCVGNRAVGTSNVRQCTPHTTISKMRDRGTLEEQAVHEIDTGVID